MTNTLRATIDDTSVPYPTVSAQTTLGVPFIPPAVVSEQSTRLRDLIGRMHRRMAPPPVRILESALSLLDHRVLVALCDAGVPDALTTPSSVAELAASTEVDPHQLDRLTRYAAARGWLKLDRHGRLHPTKVTAFLRNDHPAGWRAWVDFVAGQHIVGAVGALSLANNDNGFANVNGAPIFEWFDHHPDEWATFDAAMAAGGRMHGLMLNAAMNWGATRSVCDIGGGTGELVRTLLDRHSDWRGAVFDLPKVIDRAVTHHRMTAIAGDAFESAPPGFDVYLLVNVLHDWNDEDSVRILRNIVAVATNATRIVVVDNTRHTKPRDDLALRADILMSALTSGGRERTRQEFTTLAGRAGLRLAGVRQLGSGDHAYEFRTQATTTKEQS